MISPTSVREKTEGPSRRRERRANELTTAIVKAEVSNLNRNLNKINNTEKDDSRFEDFHFERPQTPTIVALFRIIEVCVLNKVTTGRLRRLAREVMLNELKSDCLRDRELEVLSKPSALCASSMCTAGLLTWGSEEIDDCPLRPEEMLKDHLRMHPGCSKDCYVWRLYNVAKYGYSLSNKRFRMKQIKRNHPPFDYFGECSQASLKKQLDIAGAVEEVPHGAVLFINPLLSVIRNSDLYRASSIGIEVHDESSLMKANALLDPPIKVRVCLDAGASGQNLAQPDFPFSYASINDAISMMTPGCYMAKLDLANMYLTLGLALDTRKFFGFCNKGIRMRYKRMPFGAKLGAAVLSAFMAEVLAIAAFLGLKTVINYMDDFFIVGATYAECLSNLKLLISILSRHGWTIAEEKTTMPSQLMTFIGVQLDSRSLTLSIEPEKALAVMFKFECARRELLAGTLKPSLIASLAGNCIWFSSVVTVGKIFTNPLFKLMRLVRNGKLISGGSVTDASMELFEKSYNWWMDTLRKWGEGSLLRSNVRVIPSQLIGDAVFVQQDAGDEGLGYFSALMEEEFRRIRWYARTWNESIETSSTFKELSTLDWALRSRVEWTNRLIVAVFDSSAAAFGVNNGSSPAERCMELIEAIYVLCDERNITLVSLWVPRAENTFADMLTHFCIHNRTKDAEGEFEL